MDPYKLLQNFGLGEREQEIYLTLLELGPQLPQHLARNSGIKRTTLYEIFPTLLDKGVITEVAQGKRRMFQAASPKKLLSDYKHRYKEFRDNVEALTEIYRLQGLRPKIDVYEGFDGLKRLYKRTLEVRDTIHSFIQVSKFNENMVSWLVNDYVPSRVKKRIDVKAIVPDEEESDFYMAQGAESLRVVRKVPWDKFPFRIEGMVQGKRVYFASYEKGGPLVGIMITSNQIADTLSALFDLAWEGAAAYGGK